MKVEIELDDTEVLRLLTDKLAERFRYQADEHVKRMLGLAFMEDIRARVRKELDEIFPTLVLPDGRTFREFVRDLILAVHRRTYGHERLTALIEDRIWKESERIFAEVLQPHLEEVKEKIRDTVFNKLMRRLGDETSR